VRGAPIWRRWHALGAALLLIPLAFIGVARAELSLLKAPKDTMLGAVQANDVPQIRLLLAKGTPIDGGDTNGRTALIYVASTGNIDLARLLLENGAKPSLADKTGNTPLHYAAEQGNTEIVRLLLDVKAPIDQQNRDGVTPLMVGCGNGRAAAVKLLLERGANTRKTDYTGRDALGWAQDHRQPGIVTLLRQAGVK
jgi:ankyrin repeat protein